jgi:lysophospholipase L1-like esterase
MRKKNIKRIVAVGASSCEGKVDVEGSGFVGRLRRWMESLEQHYHVYNLGISGDTTKGMLKRLTPEVKPRKPDLIMFQLGLNDARRLGSESSPVEVPLMKFEENVRKLIRQAERLAEVMFVSIYPIDEERTSPVSWRPVYYLFKDAVAYSQASKEVCIDMRVPYIDVFNQWMKEDYTKYLHSDGLHANSMGHEKIFEMVKEKIEEV